jgi:hypothetical protein
MESPLETLLGVASDTKPLLYAFAGMALFERSLRLVMEWQTHRAEMRRTELELVRTAEAEESRRLGDEAFPRLEEASDLRAVIRTEVLFGDRTPPKNLEHSVRRIASVDIIEVTRQDR